MKRLFLLLILYIAAIPVASAQNTILTLDECRRMALHADPSMHGAELDVLSAKLLKQEAAWEYLPKVQVTAAAFHALDPLVDIGLTDILGTSDRAWEISNNFSDIASQEGIHSRYQTLQHGYGTTLSLMQPLYAGGRIRNGNALASMGVEAAQLQRDMQHRQTVADAEEKYWLVVSLQEKEITLRQARETLDTLLRDATAAQSAGLLTETEVLQVRLKLSELESAEVQLLSGLRLSRIDLCNLIGITMPDSIVLDGIPTQLPAPENYYVPADEVAAQMEEVRLLDLKVDAASMQRRMTRGETLPTVGIGAVYGYGHYLDRGSLNGAVYAMATVPLSDWGKTSRHMRRDSHEVEKASTERDYLDAQLRLKALKLWSDVEVAWTQTAVAEEAMALAANVFDHQQAQFRAGLVTMGDLLQAQTSLRQCEDTLIDQRIAYLRALSVWQQLTAAR